jgi:hypothetical protein
MFISVKDAKPDYPTECIVVNHPKGMHFARAIYHPDIDAFVLYDPPRMEVIVLDVDKWMISPNSNKYFQD